jgi:hypothetical protein
VHLVLRQPQRGRSRRARNAVSASRSRRSLSARASTTARGRAHAGMGLERPLVFRLDDPRGPGGACPRPALAGRGVDLSGGDRQPSSDRRSPKTVYASRRRVLHYRSEITLIL